MPVCTRLLVLLKTLNAILTRYLLGSYTYFLVSSVTTYCSLVGSQHSTIHSPGLSSILMAQYTYTCHGIHPMWYYNAANYPDVNNNETVASEITSHDDSSTNPENNVTVATANEQHPLAAEFPDQPATTALSLDMMCECECEPDSESEINTNATETVDMICENDQDVIMLSNTLDSGCLERTPHQTQHKNIRDDTVQRWLKKYSFLIMKVEGAEMVFYCSVCMERQKKNNMTVGQKTNLQENTWQRHQKTNDHREAVAEKLGQADFQRARSAAVEKELSNLQEKEKGVIVLMKIMKFVADNSLPLSIFPELAELCRSLGCSDLQVSAVEKCN